MFVRRFAKLTAVLCALISTLTLVPAAQATAAPLYETVTSIISVAGVSADGLGGGNGICSPKPVYAFGYTVTAPAPGLRAVLAANQPAYDALKNANLDDPSSANLPPPCSI